MTRLENGKKNFGTKDITLKSEKVREIIGSLGRVMIAFSGGVDSTLLLRLSKEILGDQVIAITASSEIIPQKEIEEAKRLAGEIDVSHHIISLNPLQNTSFVANPPNRCYYCKTDLYARLQSIAQHEGALFIADGTNQDDMKDFRPGQQAALEWGVRQPLLEARLNKADIRLMSRSLNLPTWNKPSMACLASRFPYGHEITEKRLRQVEQAEEIITNLGLKQVRVRLHDENTARIEVEPEAIKQLLALEERARIISELQNLGFIYITVDLKGYQAGSVNELIKER